MTEIDAFPELQETDPHEITGEVPLMENEPEAEASAETDPETPEGEEAEATTPEPEKTPPEWSKPVQKLQQNIANLTKQLEQLTKGSKTETPVQAATRLAKAKAMLTGDKRKDLDTYMPGVSDAIEDLVAAVEDRGATAPDGLEELKTLKQELEYKAYFADYPASYRKDFEVQQKAFEEDDNMTGAELRGAMTAWFKRYVADKAANKEAGTPKRAASGSGANKVIPANTGPRRSTQPNLKRMLQAGEGGGNIGGLDMKDF
jgi:hypothetical protein